MSAWLCRRANSGMQEKPGRHYILCRIRSCNSTVRTGDLCKNHDVDYELYAVWMNSERMSRWIVRRIRPDSVPSSGRVARTTLGQRRLAQTTAYCADQNQFVKDFSCYCNIVVSFSIRASQAFSEQLSPNAALRSHSPIAEPIYRNLVEKPKVRPGCST